MHFVQFICISLIKIRSICYNPQTSMERQIIHLLLLALLSMQVKLINISSVLPQTTNHFANISEACLTLEGQSLYLLRKNPENEYAQIVKYSVSKEGLSFVKTFSSSNAFSSYWQLYRFQQEMVSFSIQRPEKVQFYDANNLVAQNTNQNHIIFRAIWVRSKKIAFLSTVKGEVGYATLKQMKSAQITLMKNSHHISNTFLSLSPNQEYVCSTDIITGLASIWNTSNKVLIKQVWVDENGIVAHSWSADSAFVYLFGYQSGIIYKLSVHDNFEIVANMSTAIPYFFSSFHSFQTDQLVAVAYNHSSLLIINFDKRSINPISLDFFPVKLKMDPSQKYLVVFNNTDLSLFKVSSLCDHTQYYNPQSQKCASCPNGCSRCDGFTCFSCQEDYYFNQDQATCQAKPATLGTISQITTSITTATLSAINQTINVPGHRQFLNVFFELFSNFDHFALYLYHDRTFGPNMQNILWQIHDTVDYRFQILSKDICSKYLGLNFNKIQSQIDFKANYSLKKYVEVQESGQGFFQSNLQYFFLNIPLIFVMLIIYHMAYKMLSSYKMSIFLKRFTLWGLIILLLLQGNIQFFFFSFTADFLSLFSTLFSLKMFNVATIMIAFIIMMLSTVGLLSLYWVYRNKSEQFYENCQSGCGSALFFVAINGIFNILRGIIHRSAIGAPQMQVFILSLIEMAQASIIIVCWRKIKLFKSSFVTVLLLCGSISRTFFNLSCLVNSSISAQTLDTFHMAIFSVNVLTFLLSVAQNIIEIAITLKKACSSKVTPQKTIKFAKKNIFNQSCFDPTLVQSIGSYMVANQMRKGSWKRNAATHKDITVKFCRKNQSKALTIQKTTNEIQINVGNRSQMESINLQ